MAVAPGGRFTHRATVPEAGLLNSTTLSFFSSFDGIVIPGFVVLKETMLPFEGWKLSDAEFVGIGRNVGCLLVVVFVVGQTMNASGLRFRRLRRRLAMIRWVGDSCDVDCSIISIAAAMMHLMRLLPR